MISKKDTVGVVIKLALITLIPLLIIVEVGCKSNNLEAYIDGKIIGYVDNKSETIQVYKELITDINLEYEDVNLQKENIKFKNIKDDNILLSNKEEIKSGILGAITGNVRAYKLNIGGKNFGYINSQERVNNVLKLVTDRYIEDLNISKDIVVSANVVCKIDLEETVINISDIKTQDEISEKIYETSINEENLLDIDINVKETVEEEIIAESIVINDDSMYMGESREDTGKNGMKLVDKEIVYTNGEISKTTILKEVILVSPQNTVIHRGSKNPYDDGIAFLSRPTRGGFTTSNYGARWESFHKGIDIAGNIGDDVMAAIDGEVIYAQYNDGGYGNLIMLKHKDNMVTYYAHLSGIYVNVGDKINKDDIIGAVGNTGFSTGPHLHFELRVNDEPVNPAEYIIDNEEIK